MRKTKRIFKTIDLTEYKNFEYYLEKKARKGWMLHEFSRGTMVFKRVEARDLRFNVCLFDQYAPFDYPDEEKGKDFRALCEDAGWTYCVSNLMFHVFYRENDDGILPIHTHPEEEYRIIKRAIFKTSMVNMMMLLLYLAMGITNLRRFNYEALLSNSNLFFYFWPFAIMVIWAVLYTHPVIWLIANRSNINRGRPLSFFSERQILVKNIVLWTVLSLYIATTFAAVMDLAFNSVVLLSMLMVIAIPGGIAIFCLSRFRKVKRSRKKNIITFAALSLLAMVLTMSGTVILMASGLTRSDLHTTVEEDVPDYALTLLDFGITDEPERIRFTEHRSMFSPQNFEYYESVGRKNAGNEIGVLRTSYLEMYNLKMATFVFNEIVDEAYEKRDEEVRILMAKGLIEKAEIEKGRIREISDEFWNIESGHYLNEENSRVVLKSGHTVYILSGDLDFSDSEVIGICNEKLRFK